MAPEQVPKINVLAANLDSDVYWDTVGVMGDANLNSRFSIHGDYKFSRGACSVVSEACFVDNEMGSVVSESVPLTVAVLLSLGDT